MNQGVVDYLKENKDKFPGDVLIEQLVRVGHLPQEIQDAVNFVYGEKNDFIVSNSSVNSVAPTSFSDFKSFKTYTIFAEKRNDFLLGFFVPIIFNVVFRFVPFFVPFVGGIISLGLYIFALVYFFRRRRFIFYGLLANFLLGIIIVFVYFIFMLQQTGFMR